MFNFNGQILNLLGSARAQSLIKNKRLDQKPRRFMLRTVLHQIMLT
jgi:hypothetical protein